ncbi:isochorismatase family protein [Angustibacter aerolatus]
MSDPQIEPAPHDWHVEQREIDRQVSRRGRVHAYEQLDPARTALVVIDMVPFFVDGADTPYVRGIVPNVRRLAEGARDAGALVVWVVPGYVAPTAVDVEFLGAEAAAVLARSGGDGEPRERVWGGFDVRDDDLVVEKTAMSAFFPGRSPLPDLLQERGVDTVVVAGTVTNVCCESSVRDASTLGYRVVLVADANAARRDRDHDATLHVVYRTFGDIRSTDDVLALLHATASSSRAT